MVSVDLYLNETTRHAHLILPPTSPLERSHYDIALSGFAVRNVAKYSPPLFAKPAGARHDHEILGRTHRCASAAARGWRGDRGAGAGGRSRAGSDPDGLLDLMLRTGAYGVRVSRRGEAGSRRCPGSARLRRQLAAPRPAAGRA